MTRPLVLASASPARLRLLQGAGLAPEVVVSHVDEHDVEHLMPAEAVLDLARRKAEAVTKMLPPAPAGQEPIVIGCDSLLEFDGKAFGKVASSEEAAYRWRLMRGHQGRLHTGHCLIDSASGEQRSGRDTATVRFGQPTDREVDAYARTAEAQQVAGPFTLEGMSAPWIEGIDGNFGTIMGISLPVVRRLLRDLGVDLIELWS